MYIGIDLGTSGVKTLLMGTAGEVLDSTQASLSVSIPQPLYSEQNPEDWWQACCQCLDELSSKHSLQEVKAIGLAGQMHGATLLDGAGKVLRPALLWNDGRSEAQCKTLEKRVRNAKDITGNLIMPGFTAPKVLWVKENEPQIFAQIDKVLLPKDYLRYRLSGDFATDMSDAAGTSWLDTAARSWSEEMLSATGLTVKHMPLLYEGNQITGYLKEDLANRWGMKTVAMVAGAGDNAAGAIGSGIVSPGQAMLSLGTSGVYFAVTREYRHNPESAVHAFCHALPNRWHLMSVMLSAASCVQWFAQNSGYPDVATMFADIEQNIESNDPNIPYFLPYLTGERTPHNNPNAKAMFFGMTGATTRAHMALAVVQGVSMALADGIDAVHHSGVLVDGISLIGGGARSAYWRQLLADVTGLPMHYREGGDVGPAFGAARLARLAMSGEKAANECCPIPPLVARYEPDSQLSAFFQLRRVKFRELYFANESLF